MTSHLVNRWFVSPRRLTSASADDDGGRERLAFGGLEPLVSLMQETSVRNLVPVTTSASTP
ncbi:MAG: hypothetical protein LC745_00320 [Planctomycetia bacterium]|nr:hypothetical protein [Planctomycetia bacterium]